jgi:hypothetical protein
MSYSHQTMLAYTEQLNVKLNATDSYKTEVDNIFCIKITNLEIFV